MVVTDWDGYKDTVRDGIDGFAVPTMTPPPGAGQLLAIRYALDLDSYDFFIGQASTASSSISTRRLLHSSAWPPIPTFAAPGGERRCPGEGTVRLEVIVKAYEELWDELARMERPETCPALPSGKPPSGLPVPTRSNSLPVFRRPGSQATIDRAGGRLHEDEVLQRLALKIVLVNATPDLSSALLLDVWLRPRCLRVLTVQDILASKRRNAGCILIQSPLLLARSSVSRNRAPHPERKRPP